jgi:hypothetical protein
MKSERRISNRITVVDLDLILKESNSQIGKVVNISDSGLLAIINSELSENNTYNFRIPFNETVNGEVNFDFNANVIWCRKNTLETSKYSVGLQFTNNAKSQSIFIHQMANKFSSRSQLIE